MSTTCGRRWLGLRGGAALALLLSVPVGADGPVVPIAIQSVVIKKLLAYDKAFEHQPMGKLMVVFATESVEQEQLIETSFRQAGFTVASTPADHLEQRLTGVSVVYVLSSAVSEQLAETCSAHGILSIAETPSPVLHGYAAIGLARSSSGRVEILLHSAKAKAEGHQFSQDLVALAHVVN